MDMTQVIIPKSDQINSDDLIAGPMTITITDVKVVGGQEQPVSVFFEGSNKAFRPCKSMSRVLVAAWGPDAKNYIGRSLTLYRDASVKWGGMAVGGIRISHMTHIDRELVLMLTMTKQNRAPHKVLVLQVQKAEPKPADQPATINPAHIEAAKAAAKLGTDAFKVWFRDNSAMRESAKSIMAELQKSCAESDKAMNDDPFGLPPVDDTRHANTLTDDDTRQAELDAAQAEFAKQRAAELAAE